MDDNRVWAFEASLWTASPEHYERCVDENVLMALPAEPFLFDGREAIEAVKRTPRWDEIRFLDQRVSRPQEGLIVIAYTAEARKADGEAYHAHCTSTYRRLGHEEWQVVQHSQVVHPRTG